MHFHLPKPLHGWRDFAGEVGIIVVGVLIALSAEQVVDNLHWRAETKGAREALLRDADTNLAAALFRQSQQPCVELRLAEIRTIFQNHAAKRPFKLTGPIGRPVYSGASREAWSIAVTSQAVAHMGLEEKLKLGASFGNFENMDQVQKQEQEAWLKLDVLDDPTVLTDGDWPMLHQAYAEANSLSSRMALITSYVLSNERLGEKRISRDPLPPGVVEAAKLFCRPVLPS